MKKTIALVFLLAASLLAHAQTVPFKLFDIQQELKMFDPMNEGFAFMTLPTDGSTCLQSYQNPTPTVNPFPTMNCLRVGGGLSRSGDTLLISSVSSAQVTAALGYTPVQPTDTRLTDARTPLAHTHAISDVTGLSAALDGKQAVLGFTPYNATNSAGYITRAGISATGAATYNSATGVLNVPASATVQRTRVTTAADGTYTWTLPTACAAPPVVSITPESATAGDAVSHRIVSVTNSTVSVFAGRSAGLVVGVLTLLGVPAGAAIPVHLLAVCP